MATPRLRKASRVRPACLDANRLADTLERLPNTEAMRQTLAELNATLARWARFSARCAASSATGTRR